MDYNRLTSSLLLLVEFLKNRFLNRISNQFSWRLAFERSSQEKRHNARPLFATSPIPPPPTATNSKPRFSSRHSSNRVTFLKREKKNPLTTVTFNRPLPPRQRNSSLFQAHARKRVALLIDTWLNDHLKRGNVLTRAMIYDPWRRPMLRRGE